MAYAFVKVVGNKLGHKDGVCFAGECELGWCDLMLLDGVGRLTQGEVLPLPIFVRPTMYVVSLDVH